MTRIVVPSAQLSANGAAVLVDTVDRRLRVGDLPEGRRRWTLGGEDDITFVSLSASGNAVAWVAEDGKVTILTAAGRLPGDPLPSPERVRAIAVGDTGDRIVLLIAASGEHPPGGSEGSLVVVPIRSSDDVGAEAEIPVYDSGFILVNDDCTLLAVRSSSSVGAERYSGAFACDGGGLRPLWTERAAPLSHGALALYGDWLFAATADGLAGWRRTGERTVLPGTMREQMIFSPDGSHLLAYRAEVVIEVTIARMLFRLIDLSSLREIRRAVHLVEQRQRAQFVLDAGLGLFAVWTTRSGDLALNALGWS